MHNINEDSFIAFPYNEKQFYLCQKGSQNFKAIANPSGEGRFNAIIRIDDVLVVRDERNLVFFNCSTK